MSAIVTKILQKVLTDEGYNHQFGSTPRTGCPDANFTLKSILQLRREMGEDSWVAFLDLVKAFDTANHSLLLQLSRRYGIPENLVQVVRKLYTDFKMELKIGSEKTIIDYLTGVKQGDVLAPTLFLFLMQAMAENVLCQWKKENIIPFTYMSDSVTGKLVRHPTQNKKPRIQLLQPGNAFLIVMLLYVNDAAICFTSHKDMVQGVSIIEKEMRQLGLVMHAGTLTKKSKAQFLYIPSIVRTKTIIDECIARHALPVSTSCVVNGNKENKKKRQLTENEKHKILVEEYEHLPETSPFQTELGGIITPTKDFIYLGSLIHFSLRDKYDIELRIKKAGQIMGALAFFWK